MIGIDPGLRGTGCAVLAKKGPGYVAHHTCEWGLDAHHKSTEAASWSLFRELSFWTLPKPPKSKTVQLGLEQIFLSNKRRGIDTLLCATGVILSACGQRYPTASVHRVTPSQAKKVTGNGKAKKEQIIAWARDEWGVLCTEHAADALAIATVVAERLEANE